MKSTKEERSWILYDVANSAFVLVMVTAIIPLFYKDFAAGQFSNAASTAHLGFANSTASLILAVLSPILGAMADYRMRKKMFFLFFLLLGLSFNFSLTLIGEGQWFLCLLLFVLARIGWAGANIFYDAFLIDVTTKKRMDIISTKGYGYGYIGSVLPFLIIIGLILSSGVTDGIPEKETKIGFVIVGIWWLLFSIPAVKNFHQHHHLPETQTPVADSFKRILRTLKEVKKHRQVFIFLTAYFFYIDGVSTIISMSTAYGYDLGFSNNLLIIVLLFIQIVAFPFAILFGKLAARFTARKMLLGGIAMFTAATFLAFLLPFIEDLSLQTILFWIIAFMISSAMGGVQALSRSYFGKLIPPEKSAEFFGFYNVFGKFAAISGPLLMGVVGSLTGDTRWGVLSILLLFVIGGGILLRMKEH